MAPRILATFLCVFSLVCSGIAQPGLSDLDRCRELIREGKYDEAAKLATPLAADPAAKALLAEANARAAVRVLSYRDASLLPKARTYLEEAVRLAAVPKPSADELRAKFLEDQTPHLGATWIATRLSEGDIEGATVAAGTVSRSRAFDGPAKVLVALARAWKRPSEALPAWNLSDPLSASATASLALRREDFGTLRRAVAGFEPDATLFASVLARREGADIEADRLWGEALARDPGNPEVYLERARDELFSALRAQDTGLASDSLARANLLLDVSEKAGALAPAQTLRSLALLIKAARLPDADGDLVSGAKQAATSATRVESYSSAWVALAAAEEAAGNRAAAARAWEHAGNLDATLAGQTRPALDAALVYVARFGRAPWLAGLRQAAQPASEKGV